jgi:cell division protease FtsH
MTEQNKQAPAGSEPNESLLDKAPLWSRVLLVMLLGLTISYLYAWYVIANQVEVISYSTFKAKVVENAIVAVTIRGKTVEGQYAEKAVKGKSEAQSGLPETSRFRTILPPFEDQELLPLLEKHNVALTA